MSTKKCSRCKQLKSLDCFTSNKCKKDGLNQECKDCRKISYAIQKAKGKHRWYDMKKSYGIGEKEYKELLIKQNNKCAICKCDSAELLKGVLYVDHCHTTGKIRGLLCNHCNLGIGHLKDNLTVLRNAVKYLEYDEEAGL